MPDNFNDDALVSAQALQRSLDSIATQLLSFNAALTNAKKKRADHIEAEVERLLPSISDDVLKNLQAAAPSFVDDTVQQAFADNGKFLGIFNRPGYQQAFAALRTRLAQHVDHSRMGALPRMDAELESIITERNELEKMQRETHDSLRMLEQATKNNVVLPPEAMAQISLMAANARDIADGKNAAQLRNERRLPAAIADPALRRFNDDDSDDTDSWVYFATLIPSGLRSTLESELSRPGMDDVQGRGGSFDGGGASGNFSSLTDIEEDISRIANQSVDNAPIATDDRLGSFS